MKHLPLFVVALVLALSAAPAQATYTHGQDMAASNMRTFSQAKAPIGYVRFCRNHSRACAPYGRRTGQIRLTAERRQELEEVNRLVNRSIRPVTDAQQFNVAEKWTYAESGKGDCEEYVLLKRRMLMERGWPASALLITVVRDTRGEGHAVLTVVTDKGDLVLDNQRRSIRHWNKTGYYYIKRQSQQHPNAWVSLRSVNVAGSQGHATGRTHRP